MNTNREHVDQWLSRPLHSWSEQYREYRYWSNGPLVSVILATIAWIGERRRNAPER
jgi:hypothetical protein